MTCDKVPPQAIDVEEAVLGALMLEADAIHKVTGIIDSGSFYKPEHQTIFEAIKNLSETGRPIDLLTVTKQLHSAGNLEEIGGPVYITELTSRVASAAHIEYHAKIISQTHLKRELIKIGSELVSSSFDEGEDLENILTDVKRKIGAIEDHSYNSNAGQLQNDVCKNAIIEIERDCQIIKEGKTPGITTGLKTIDECIGGWRNTNLIILAARPSVGKTSLALHFAKVAARSGKWVNFYTLETKKEILFRTLLSGESGVNRSDIRDGRLTEANWITINAAVTSLENLPIIWYDFAGITANQIKSNTVKNRKNKRCDLVIIDYLQLVKPADKKVYREQQISEMSRTFKEMALSEDIPVICLSQLNREAANDEPQLHHLRESGAIEQDADLVIFPWRDKSESYLLKVSKNRNGKIGSSEIFANDEMTVFGNKMQILSKSFNPDRNIDQVRSKEETPF